MNSYKYETASICRSKGWDRAPIEMVWLLFTEEVGELASAIRNYKRMYVKHQRRKQDIILEMGDVFSYLFQMAYMLDIDLDQMWKMHMAKMVTKNYYS